jgi:DNA-binding Lrp family transcriptional regulator
MARAYLKVDVEPGKEREVKGALLGVEGVRSADLTAGEQDLIVLIEAPSYEAILELVVGKLRGIEGIRRTVTNLVLE